MKVWEKMAEKLRWWWNEDCPLTVKERFLPIDVSRKMWHELTDEERLAVYKLYGYGLIKSTDGQIIPVEIISNRESLKRVLA